MQWVSCRRMTSASSSVGRWFRTLILLAVRPSMFIWSIKGPRNVLVCREKGSLCAEQILLIQKDKVKALVKKLNLWKANLQKSNLDMFPLLNWCTRVNVEANKNLFVKLLNGLLLHFSNYFDDPDFTKDAWIHLSTKKMMNLDWQLLRKNNWLNYLLILHWNRDFRMCLWFNFGWISIRNIMLCQAKL